MLLDDNSSTELSDVDATSLIRLICSSVKKAVGERIVPATDNRKQYHTKAQRVSLFLKSLQWTAVLDTWWLIILWCTSSFVISLSGCYNNVVDTFSLKDTSCFRPMLCICFTPYFLISDVEVIRILDAWFFLCTWYHEEFTNRIE